MTSFPEAVESNNQLIAVWSRLVAEQGGEVSSAGGVCRIWADSAFGFWNTVTLTSADISAVALKEQLGRAGMPVETGRHGQMACPGWATIATVPSMLSPPSSRSQIGPNAL